MDVGEVAVADDLGIGIVALQVLQEEPKSRFLLRGASVGITAFFVEASFIADADGVLVVVADMGAGIFLGATFSDLTIAVDIPVVADHLPAAGLVPAVDVVDRDVLGGASARTVKHNIKDFAHWFHLFCHNNDTIGC